MLSVINGNPVMIPAIDRTRTGATPSAHAGAAAAAALRGTHAGFRTVAPTYAAVRTVVPTDAGFSTVAPMTARGVVAVASTHRMQVDITAKTDVSRPPRGVPG